MPAPAIALHQLSKTFGSGRRSIDAVRGVDLEVEAGQVYGFLGPNGAGKSTTIRMIADLVRPTTGHVELFGERIDRSRTVLRRMGALVEGALFYPHLSGRRNLEVLARTQGRLNRTELEALLERVDLSSRDARPVSAYSMGMKQRLGVAAALLGQPELLILDEPTNGLDPAGIREMRSFVRSLASDEGLTVFLSSHLLAEVEQVCDEVAIINNGEIVRLGKVADLLGEQHMLRLSAAPCAEAARLLRQFWEVEQRADDLLLIDAPRSSAPELVRRLVEAGIDIFEISSDRRSLEDLFFEVTEASSAKAPR